MPNGRGGYSPAVWATGRGVSNNLDNHGEHLMDQVRCRIRVTGRVQGVGYRYFTRRIARVHGVTGWVRNGADGSVEAEVQGEQPAVDTFVEDLRAGPPLSYIRNVSVSKMPPLEEELDFEIRF